MAVAGMLLIAATYGMARFGVGLFAPYLAAERPGLVGVLGWAAAAQFTSYSLAAALSIRWADRHPRWGLALAGATATLGCAGIAVATTPAAFIASVLVAGLGGGFASPSLVPVLDALVDSGAAATAQSVVNAGTAIGVIGAGGVAFAASAIGPAWLLMALVCAAAWAALWTRLRGRGDLRPASGRGKSPVLPRGSWKAVTVPGTAAVVVGIGSAMTWTFGPLLVTTSGTVAPGHVGWLWIALGLGGFFGAAAGMLVERFGLRGAWCAGAGAVALASAGVAWSVGPGGAWMAYASLALFGAGYIGLTGVLILWARRVWPRHPGAGTSVLFIAVATGQAAGSAGFGVLQGSVDPAVLAAAAAGWCLLGGVVALLGRGPHRTPACPPRHGWIGSGSAAGRG